MKPRVVTNDPEETSGLLDEMDPIKPSRRGSVEQLKADIRKAISQPSNRLLVVSVLSILSLMMFLGMSYLDFSTFSFNEDIFADADDVSRQTTHLSPQELFRTEDFAAPVKTCNGEVWYTASICDHTGFCQVTGLARRFRSIYVNSILNPTIPNEDGDPLPITYKDMFWADDNHGRRYDAFRAFYQIPAEEAANVEYFLADNCNNETKIKVPVDFRMKKFNGKLVLIISQFYSKVRLSWLSVYMKHYLKIGVDYIALYTAFKPGAEYIESYDKKLTALINQPMFKDHVVRFNFSEMSVMNSWSRAQAGMINHGATLFFGSTMMSLDLDEIVVPRQHKTLIPFIRDYNQRHGNWAGHFHPFNTNIKLPANEMKKEFNLDYNFTKLVKKARGCGFPAKTPHRCRAKWIYHSLDMETVQIHRFKFREPIYQETWLNEKVVVGLHLRGIQGRQDIAQRTRNEETNEYEDFEHDDPYLLEREQLYDEAEEVEAEEEIIEMEAEDIEDVEAQYERFEEKGGKDDNDDEE
eukprot:CAMPEP_0184031416 /NCGR_PEP_ID=MMETSP0955-20130417/2226_1 /TAXON_ID=627963 /ORGANISM="Aplanochytrium sp, Strain PBS07" /LENGTH=522 /DNA_ID=CAMNT_0026317159 /DNA_START=129 /DNA_END=1697 /DNA_ORIENTATION=+